MPYVNRQRVGVGGYADVYRCEREGNGQVLAMKVLRDAGDRDAVERFRREVRILSDLDHPKIIKVLDAHVDEEPYWFIMPYYTTSLRTELILAGVDEGRTRRIFPAILEAIEYAHSRGILHRDLKPSNILLDGDEVVVSDFGLGRIVDTESTRMTKSGDWLGTFDFMSPEQMADPKSVDARSEVYSLGRILYSLYVGHFLGGVQDTSRIDPGAALIVDRCTQRDPGRRYQSVRELSDAWSRMFEQNPTEAETDELKALSEALSERGDAAGADFDRFMQLLRKYAGDPAVLHETVMRMGARLATEAYAVNHDFMRRVVNDFVEHANAQSWDYDYTDRIGSACRTLFSTLNDYGIRAALIHCLLEVGYGHNRYYVMRLFKELIEARKQPGEGLAIYERLKDLDYYRRKQAHDALDLAVLDPQVARLFGDEMEAKKAAEEQGAADFPF